MIFNSHKMTDLLAQLSNQYNCPIKKDCFQHQIQLKTPYFSGIVKGYLFEKGFNLLIVQGKQKKANWDWTFSSKNIPPVQIHALRAGQLQQQVAGEKSPNFELTPMQGAIISTPNHQTQKYRFNADQELIWLTIWIDRAAFLARQDCHLDHLHPKLAAVFQDNLGEIPVLFPSFFGIEAANCIQEMLLDENKGMIHNTLMESKTLELIQIYFKHFKEEYQSDSQPIAIKPEDLKKLVQAKALLVENLQDAPTIKELAKLSGINRQKLKTGFKLVFGQTINAYLRNTRLEEARNILLKKQSLTVLELANLVGYSSQSHFARRFKEKYGANPKAFIKSLTYKLSDFEQN